MANTIDFNVNSNAVTVLNQTGAAAQNTAQGFTSAKAELRALRQIGCHEYSFLGIPNDCIDVSHEVTRIYLEAKPEAFVGIDRPNFDESEFESFVRRVLDLKGFIKCNKNDLSSLSSKTQLASPTDTKESFDAFAVQPE